MKLFNFPPSYIQRKRWIGPLFQIYLILPCDMTDALEVPISVDEVKKPFVVCKRIRLQTHMVFFIHFYHLSRDIIKDDLMKAFAKCY